MPKLLFARPPLDAVEERKIRKLAGARHAPADWIRRAQIIALSWDGMRVPAIAGAPGYSQKAVRYRLARFATEGLDGLGGASDGPAGARRPGEWTGPARPSFPDRGEADAVRPATGN